MFGFGRFGSPAGWLRGDWLSSGLYSDCLLARDMSANLVWGLAV